MHLGAVSEVLGVAMQCDAINGDVTHDTWRLRCSFPVYLIAMSATAGALILTYMSFYNTMNIGALAVDHCSRRLPMIEVSHELHRMG